MKEIKLTQGKVAQVDDEDFEELNKHKWYTKKCGKLYYAVRNEVIPNSKHGRRQIYMHRVILGIDNSKIFTDHKDGNGLNNQKCNIRKATRDQNAMNVRSRENSTSPYIGISWHLPSLKWVAHIRANGVFMHLGYFDDEIEAAKTRDVAAIKYRGEWAKLNFPQPQTS